MSSDEIFYAKHDACPQGVYVVTVYPEERQAIFTNKAAVSAWLESLPEYVSSLVVPYVLDEPDFGNKIKKQMV